VFYVAGFFFSTDYSQVALVLKNRPTYQAGKFNGIGGKVEPGETAEAAMEREFREEAGITVMGWQRFATLAGGRGGAIDFNVHFFAAVGSFDGIRSVTDEEIIVMPVAHLPTVPRMGNLDWLIPMAIACHRGTAGAKSFMVTETG
jgi:8-oxo-dGTP diphosphatase